jgi:hypothetical protein
VDLSLGEIEFIAKVNRENLQFAEESLPDWAQEKGSATALEPVSSGPNIAPRPLLKEEDKVTLSDLGDRFRKAIQPGNPIVEPAPLQLRNLSDKPVAPAMETGTNSRGQTVQVKRVVFPRVNPNE